MLVFGVRKVQGALPLAMAFATGLMCDSPDRKVLAAAARLAGKMPVGSSGCPYFLPYHWRSN